GRPDVLLAEPSARPAEGFAKVLPEAPLKGLEREVLAYDPETEEYVLRPSAVRMRRSTRRRRGGEREVGERRLIEGEGGGRGEGVRWERDGRESPDGREGVRVSGGFEYG
ncbi:putative alpha/beta hydrolase domain (DUF2235), partial [Teratosphaeria destructans]